jgi:predicted NBD/HSP70 family sugar kinase
MSSPLPAMIERVHEGSPHRIKDREKALLFREIFRGRSPTRKSMARVLHIRPSSVSQAVQELVDDGLVEETQAQIRRKSGRPHLILSPRADRFVAISLYTDSRELKGVLVNPSGGVLAEEVRIVRPEARNTEMFKAILDSLLGFPPRVPRGSELIGASLSLVGTVNEHTRTWVTAARWPGLRDLDLSELERRLGLPVILRRTNDTELVYVLECRPVYTKESVLLFHWGFGIGSAMSYRGTLLASSIGRFGEIGHTRIGPASEALCICGSKGCLETEAALWALLPRLRRRLGNLPEDEKELTLLLGSSRLLALPEVERALRAVQSALLTLYRIFSPDAIMLSGPFPENNGVFRRLAHDFNRALPSYARGAVTLSVIPGGLRGCRLGGANPLFHDAFRRALRRRP